MYIAWCLFCFYLNILARRYMRSCTLTIVDFGLRKKKMKTNNERMSFWMYMKFHTTSRMKKKNEECEIVELMHYDACKIFFCNVHVTTAHFFYILWKNSSFIVVYYVLFIFFKSQMDIHSPKIDLYILYTSVKFLYTVQYAQRILLHANFFFF